MFEFSPGDLISVVVPAYGHERFIEQALDSVYNQTYQNLELIVVDDLSKDNTYEIASRWAKQKNVKARFANLAVLQNQLNIGANKTINHAISLAQGKLIGILNSDDTYAHQRFEIVSNAMMESGTGFAFSKVSPIDEQGNFANTYHLPIGIEDVFEFADRVANTMPAMSFGFLQRNIAISTGNFVIHRDLLKKIGNFRPLLYVHDWDFALRAICECEPAYIPVPLYRYRIHGSNSFKALAHVGAIENEKIVSDFLAIAKNAIINNKQAPIRENWPDFFNSINIYLSVLGYIPKHN